MNKNHRAFLLGLGLGLFFFITVAGLLTVDYQGRKMSFGDSTPLAGLRHQDGATLLTVKAFGAERTWDVTELEKAWQFFCDFNCIPRSTSSQEGGQP